MPHMSWIKSKANEMNFYVSDWLLLKWKHFLCGKIIEKYFMDTAVWCKDNTQIPPNSTSMQWPIFYQNSEPMLIIILVILFILPYSYIHTYRIPNFWKKFSGTEKMRNFNLFQHTLCLSTYQPHRPGYFLLAFCGTVHILRTPCLPKIT